MNYIFKDLKISYFITAISGVVLLIAVLGSLTNIVVGVLCGLLWIFICVTFFTVLTSKRLTKFLKSAYDNCNVIESLNKFYGFYKGRTNNTNDLIFAIYISSLLLGLGKIDLALKHLLLYNPEVLLKNKRFIVLKYSYYNTLMSCYSRLGRKDEALIAFNKSDELLNSPNFDKRVKNEIILDHKANYLILTDDGTKSEEILALLRAKLEIPQKIYGVVTTRFRIARILVKNERIDEAKEHIDFLAENGGDTYCARCALKNDFSLEYQQEINHESIEINPVKPKNNKSVVFSILSVIIMIILLGFVSYFNVSTIYKSDFNMSGIEYLHEYDKNGNILTFQIRSQKFYYSEEEQKRAEDYKYFEQYLGLNNYKGCNVTLIENNMNEIHTELPNVISFSVVIDYRKTNNQIFEVMSDVELTEKEYLSKHKDKSYTIHRYKKYLGVATIFDGVIEDMQFLRN